MVLLLLLPLLSSALEVSCLVDWKPCWGAERRRMMAMSRPPVRTAKCSMRRRVAWRVAGVREFGDRRRMRRVRFGCWEDCVG